MEYCQISAVVKGTIGYRLRQIFNNKRLNYSVKAIRQSNGRKIEFATVVPLYKKEEVILLIKENSNKPIITVFPVLDYDNLQDYQEVREISLSAEANVSSLAELYDGVSIGAFSRVVGNAMLQEDVSVGKENFIGSGVVIRSHTELGDNCYIATDAIIGNNVKIGNNVTIEENVTIRSNVIIGDNVSIGTAANIESNVEVKSNVRIGPKSRIFNVGRKRAELKSTEDRKVIATVINSGTYIGSAAIVGGKIGNKVMVGTNSVVHTATVGDEVTIGSGAVVPFGSVIESGLTVIGSPAKSIEEYKQEKRLKEFLKEKYKHILNNE